MKAIVQNAYGSPAALELKEIDNPAVKDGGVLVRARAAALHAGDCFIMRGTPYLVRFVAGWPRNVTRFQPGDAVFGMCGRACAEYACAKEDTFVLKPANLTFEQAAAVPTSAFAALHGLRDAGKVQPGHQVSFRSKATLTVTGKTRTIRGEDRKFFSVATVGS